MQRGVGSGLSLASMVLVLAGACSDKSGGGGGGDAAAGSEGGAEFDASADSTGGDVNGGDSSVADSAPADSSMPMDASEAAQGDAGEACAPTPCVPTQECDLGSRACGSSTCTDTGMPAPDGTSCTGGTCARGTCAPNVTVPGGTTNLTTTTLTAGRTCPDAPVFSVDALTSTTATLDSAPVGDCLAAGDEVLLVNLQGTATSTVNIGVFEDMHVLSVSGTTVTFASAKAGFYGDGASDDTNIGTGATQQKVAVVRVPVFGNLDVPVGATLTAGAWNGVAGGVIALRAAALTVEGTVTAVALGYGDGMWSQDGLCSTSLQTTAGESIDGIAGATTANNVGGSGGIGPGVASFNGSTPLSPSAGHANAGQAGGNGQDRTIGLPGVPYGVGDGTRVTMGSGGGGSVTCAAGAVLHLFNQPPEAGGIVALFGGSITVSAGGVVDASAIVTSRSAGSGGYVLLRGDTLDLGVSLVRAKGGTTDPQGPGSISNAGSDGFIAAYYRTSIAGTTDPAATAQQTNNP